MDIGSLVQALLKSVTTGRVVTFLTPLVFAPLAGWVAIQATKLGFHYSADQVLDVIVQGAVFVVGALIAYLKSAQWLRGYREWENNKESAALYYHSSASLDPELDERVVSLDEPHTPLGMQDRN